MDKKQRLTPVTVTSLKNIYFYEFNTFRTLQVFFQNALRKVQNLPILPNFTHIF
jgi:hypothetical protein